MERTSEHTHFGERTVRFDEKQGLVDAVFHKVADRIKQRLKPLPHSHFRRRRVPSAIREDIVA